MEVIINPDNLNDYQINKYNEKVRLLILNSNNQILLSRYNGIYMLPAVEIDNNETPLISLKKMIKEQLGISTKKIDKLVTLINYQKDYPDNYIVNRKIKTNYYITKQEIETNNLKRQDDYKWIDINDIELFIRNYRTINPQDPFFRRELLKVIEIYKSKNMIDIERPKGLIDLHTHTIYSDGELEPLELIKKAIDDKIKILAITDHDTIKGLKTIDKNNPLLKKIRIINGIELSAKVSKGRMHILGYDFDLDNEYLNKKLDSVKTNSYYSILSMLNQLKLDYGIMFDWNDIQNLYNSIGNINRANIAKLLVKYKYVDNIKEGFNKYLNTSYQKIRKYNKGLTSEECISLIKEANGLSILAHPNQLLMDDKKLEETLKKLIDCGLDGIEVYHSTHSKEEIKKYLYLAKKYNLLISGGSDYHGASIKPNIKLGTGMNNNLKIKKLSLIDKINNR